jgi:serine protease Do
VIFPGNSGGPLVNLKGEIIGVNEIGMGLGGAIPCDIAKHVSEELIAKGRVRRSWTGVVFQPLLKYNGNNVKSGVLISGILAGSPAERAGLKAGDVVIAIDEQAIHVQFQQELPALIKLLCAKPVDAMIQFKIVRAGEEITLAVKSELRDDAQGKDIESKEWGLTLRRLSVLESKELKRSDLNGVLVDSVRPGGPCDQAQPSISARDVIVEVAGKPITDLESFVKITTEITEGKTAPVPTLVAYERRTERCLTLVEIGIRKPQDPPEEVKKAWLSVTTQVLSKKLATALELKGKKGVRITQVYPDTTAEKAGFKVGDILTHIDAAAIEASEPQDAQVFETMLRSYKVTDKAEFTILRGKQTLKITSELTPTPKSERELKTYEDNALEFKARDISFMDRVKNSWKKDETGVLVTQTDAGGWAAVGGLRSDDLILSVDSKPVAEIKDLEPLLVSVREKQPRAITLFVKRGSHTLYLQLEPRWLEKK